MSDFDAFARFYDADYGGFLNDLPFYRALVRRTGGPVIELMCGSGRLLAPLAREGIDLVGVDISPRFVAQAQEKLAPYGERIQVAVGDVRSPLPGGPYKLAFVAINSFMHLETTEDQIAALKHIHAALEPGGLLALDLFNPDPRELLRHNGEVVLDRVFRLNDGTQVQKFVVQSVDMLEQTIDVRFLYDELVEQTVRRTLLPFVMRWLYRYEIEHLLARCGFVLETVYGSYELGDFEQSSPVMLIVAARQGSTKRAH